ncbi:MAG TPA: DUF488 domain-containing protein [Gemmataceae bacterium]|nr:DUF488 domain-containing protein [Gemmataceae bacterium]
MVSEWPERFSAHASGSLNPGGSAARLFTIGHSNHDPEAFLNLLRRAEISAVADVRSLPSSMRHPHFNRPELEGFLKHQGITYVFLGDFLGGRPQQPSLYDVDGRVDYERVRKMPFFEQGLERLIKGQDQYRIALVCAEEDPLHCHRGLMIAPALVERGLAPVHLRGDGSMETTEDLEKRLFAETKVGAGILDGLFASTISPEDRKRLLADAYRDMARRKGFRRRPDTQPAADFREEIDDFGE